jgi:hypothetical protein
MYRFPLVGGGINPRYGKIEIPTGRDMPKSSDMSAAISLLTREQMEQERRNRDAHIARLDREIAETAEEERKLRNAIREQDKRRREIMARESERKKAADTAREIEAAKIKAAGDRERDRLARLEQIARLKAADPKERERLARIEQFAKLRAAESKYRDKKK